jgi:hypothetical protein
MRANNQPWCGRCGARSLWAISRPLPGKPFPNEWDFCVEACALQDRDRFVFGDFVVVIATFFDGLDECFELFLRDPGAQDHRFASKIHSRIIAEKLIVALFSRRACGCDRTSFFLGRVVNSSALIPPN